MHSNVIILQYVLFSFLLLVPKPLLLFIEIINLHIEYGKCVNIIQFWPFFLGVYASRNVRVLCEGEDGEDNLWGY